MDLYHTTSPAIADRVDVEGFEDSIFAGIEGVFLSDRPLDAADGVARCHGACIKVSVPEGFELSEWEVIESDRPADVYREWLIPSSIVNEWARTRKDDDTAA